MALASPSLIVARVDQIVPVTKTTFNWKHLSTRHTKSLQRLLEIVAMSRQGGVKRAVARMRMGDQVVQQRRFMCG